MTINKVILIGRLGKDPISRTTQNGKEWSSFTMATSKKVNGEERTQWHNVTVWNEQNAIYINSFAQKGTLLYLEGEIEYRQYDKDGVTMYGTDIVVPGYGGTVQILKDGVPRDQGNEQHREAQVTRTKKNSYGEASGGGRRTPRKPAPAEEYQDNSDLDDEIPF